MINTKVFRMIFFSNPRCFKWTQAPGVMIFLASLAILSELLGGTAACEKVHPIAGPAGTDEGRFAITPLVVLHHTVENFFVLASDIPFEVRKVEPEVSWMRVENIKGAQTAHRIIPIKSKPHGLPKGTYFSAIRVGLTTSLGEEYILIPVALQVGEEFERDLTPNRLLKHEVPEKYVRLQVSDKNIDVRFMMTPGGHFVFEIIDLIKQRRKIEKLHESNLFQYEENNTISVPVRTKFPFNNSLLDFSHPV